MKILKKHLRLQISNTPTHSQLPYSYDINPTEDNNINNPFKTHIHNLPNQIAAEKETTSLKPEVVALKELFWNSCI